MKLQCHSFIYKDIMLGAMLSKTDIQIYLDFSLHCWVFIFIRYISY